MLMSSNGKVKPEMRGGTIWRKQLRHHNTKEANENEEPAESDERSYREGRTFNNGSAGLTRNW